MDDLHSFHTRSYDKSDELEEIKPWQKAISLLIALPLLLVKLLIILLALIFEVLKFFFFCIVPRPLNDIRDQLAVVSVIEMHHEEQECTLDSLFTQTYR